MVSKVKSDVPSFLLQDVLCDPNDLISYSLLAEVSGVS